jgi:hypothetical protein
MPAFLGRGGFKRRKTMLITKFIISQTSTRITLKTDFCTLCGVQVGTWFKIRDLKREIEFRQVSEEPSHNQKAQARGMRGKRKGADKVYQALMLTVPKRLTKKYALEPEAIWTIRKGKAVGTIKKMPGTEITSPAAEKQM